MSVPFFAISLILYAVQEAGPASAPPVESPFEVKVIRDVVYGKGRVVSAGDAPTTSVKDLLLDAYIPVGAEAPDKAAVILIHGGGFTGGDKTKPRFPDLAQAFAGQGMVCFSINYRLVRDNPPTPGDDPRAHAMFAAIRDTKAAVRWVRANAEKHGVSPDRIGLIGGSAGGYCAVIASITDDDLFASDGPDDPTAADNHPEQSAHVQACVDLWGGAGPYLDRIGPRDPPMLIIHGTEDQLVAFARATELRDKCAEVGLSCVFHPLEGSGHAPWNKEFDSIRQWSMEFLAEHLTSASPAPARH